MKKQDGFDLTKALSFLLVFIAMAMIIGVGFLVPTVRSLNKQSILLEVETRSYNAVKEKYDEESRRLNTLKKENETALTAITTTFDAKLFQKTTQSGVKTFQIQKIDESTEGPYSFVNYGVSMTVQNPKAIFDFLDNIGRSGSLIQIVTPITISTANNGDIIASFYLKAITTELASEKSDKRSAKIGGGH